MQKGKAKSGVGGLCWRRPFPSSSKLEGDEGGSSGPMKKITRVGRRGGWVPTSNEEEDKRIKKGI